MLEPQDAVLVAASPVLKALVERAALPLKAIETTFAPDSTGFSTSRFTRWYDEKYGRERVAKPVERH